MKQTASIISTYSADVFGVCSALYELGGMTVMHDASGCNSTYNTHDEPRWYDMDSMVYITGLSEMEAIMGDDSKLISDIIDAAKELSPKFIAIAGTPIPMMIGTDFRAIASVIEKNTGIPCFGFATNGMHSYISGISMAFEAFADKMTDRNVRRSDKLSANIIGFTPLDFSTVGYTDSIVAAVKAAGFDVVSTWAMNTNLDDIKRSAEAHVNLVVSSAGLKAARKLQSLYGTPYVIGTPTGTDFTAKIIADMKLSAADGLCRSSFTDEQKDSGIIIIGESVMSRSLASALKNECGVDAKVVCSSDTDYEVKVNFAEDEDDVIRLVRNAEAVIADPLFKPVCPKTAKFITLPHEAFSGRIYRNQIPDLIKDFEIIKKEVTQK